MKKLFAMLLAAAMICGVLASCGEPDRQPAIDAFNAASTAFDSVANAINANPEAYPQDVINSLVELSGVLTDHKALLEGDDPLTQESLDEMIAWYATVEELIAEIKTEYKIQ